MGSYHAISGRDIQDANIRASLDGHTHTAIIAAAAQKLKKGPILGYIKDPLKMLTYTLRWNLRHIKM